MILNTLEISNQHVRIVNILQREKNPIKTCNFISNKIIIKKWVDQISQTDCILSRRNNVSVMLDYRTDFHLNKGGRVDIR